MDNFKKIKLSLYAVANIQNFWYIKNIISKHLTFKKMDDII